MRNETTVALDLGLNTGWAVRKPDGSLESGSWKLGFASPEAYSGFSQRLGDLLDRAQPGAIGYEHVAGGHRGIQAAHVFGALEALLFEAASSKGVELWRFGVGTWKQGALGKGWGLARPDVYLALARQRWPSLSDATTDEAAARLMASWWRPGLGSRVEESSKGSKAGKGKGRGKARRVR